MLASSTVDISVMAKQGDFFDQETPGKNLRRNFVFLFDNMKNQVMKLDVTIGISLLD